MLDLNIYNLIDIINSNVKKINITETDIDVDLTTIGLDSIAFIKLIVALEENFNCEIPDSMLLVTKLNTLRKIFSCLQSIING